MSTLPEKEYRGSKPSLWPNILWTTLILIPAAVVMTLLYSHGHMDLNLLTRYLTLYMAFTVEFCLLQKYALQGAWVRLTDTTLAFLDWGGKPRELDWAGIEEMMVWRFSAKGPGRTSLWWRGQRFVLVPTAEYGNELVEEIIQRVPLAPAGRCWAGLQTVYRRTT